MYKFLATTLLLSAALVALTASGVRADAPVWSGASMQANSQNIPSATYEFDVIINSSAPELATSDPSLIFVSAANKNYTCMLNYQTFGINTAGSFAGTFQPQNPDAHIAFKSCDFSSLPDGTYTVLYVLPAAEGTTANTMATGVTFDSRDLVCDANAASGQTAAYCRGNSGNDHHEDEYKLATILLGIAAALSFICNLLQMRCNKSSTSGFTAAN